MTLSRSHRRLTARAFLAIALLAVVGATWLPCTQALAAGAHAMAHHGPHCGHCPEGDGQSPDGIEKAASPHCVDVTRGSPDSRAAVALLPALAPPLLAWRVEPLLESLRTRPPDPGSIPRPRPLHLEKSVLLI